jgi:hypothetical protein
MPSDDWAEGLDWSELEEELFTALGNEAMLADWRAQELFDLGYFERDIASNERVWAREELQSYLEEYYNVDFQSEFDWETWRENYE